MSKEYSYTDYLELGIEVCASCGGANINHNFDAKPSRGKVFLRMFREYLNRDAFTHYIQGRKDEGTWSHSLNQSESDSFVLYVKPKEEEWFKERQENIEAKLLNVTNLKNHKLDILERKVIELQTELNAIRTDIENIER